MRCWKPLELGSAVCPDTGQRELEPVLKRTATSVRKRKCWAWHSPGRGCEGLRRSLSFSLCHPGQVFLRSMLRGAEVPLRPKPAATKWDAPWLLLEGSASVGQQRRPWRFPDTVVTPPHFCLRWLLGSPRVLLRCQGGVQAGRQEHRSPWKHIILQPMKEKGAFLFLYTDYGVSE